MYIKRRREIIKKLTFLKYYIRNKNRYNHIKRLEAQEELYILQEELKRINKYYEFNKE